MEVAEVKRQLAARSEAVCRELLPHGKIHSNEWCCGDLSGSEGESLKVHLTGTKAGLWSDFATGVGGSNLLELWIQARNLPYRDALTAAQNFLGVTEPAIKQHRVKTYQRPNKEDVVKLKPKHPAEIYLTLDRQIDIKTLKDFKIALSKQGEIVFPFLTLEGELENIKYMKVDRNEKGKKQIRTSPAAKKALFGKHLIRPEDRSIIICEGEIDAMSWHQLGYRALSVPYGAKSDGADPNGEWIENDWELLGSMERIYISFDDDDEGKKARTNIITRLGRERCFIIRLPDGIKDANEALQNRLFEEMEAAYAGAKTEDPENLKNASEYLTAVTEILLSPDGKPIIHGIPMPWSTPTGEFHWRLGEVTLFSGYNGSGKTMFLNALTIELGLLGRKVCDFSFEVVPAQTLRYMVSQTLGKDFPDDIDELKQAVNFVSEFLWFYDHIGLVKLDEVFAAMEYAHRRYGIQFFIVDSWMKLGIALDDWTAQSMAMERFCQFAMDRGVHIIIVAHSKKTESERERGGKMQIKGTGDLSDKASNIFVIHRNKKKEDEIKAQKEKNTQDARIKIDSIMFSQHDAILACEKQKNGNGEEPLWRLWFDLKSRQYSTSKVTPKAKIAIQELLTEPEPPPPDEPDAEIGF
jgi:twinkle protein